MSIFSKIPIQRRRRSKFKMDHDVNMTTDFSKLVPILAIDCVPGDRFKLGTEIHMKWAPQIYPIMSRVNVRVDYFFVPNRLLWSDWENFITRNSRTGRPITSEDEEIIAPVFVTGDLDDAGFFDPSADTVGVGSLWDYIGMPPYIDDNQPTCYFDLLPFAAYQKVYNDWYRDQNFEPNFDVKQLVDFFNDPSSRSLNGAITDDDGNEFDIGSLLELRHRNWQKDYFTSALPWAQRGEAALLPVGDRAPVNGQADPTVVYTSRYQDSGEVFANFISTSHDHVISVGGEELQHGHTLDAFADLSAATGISIPEFRKLNAVQKWLEDNARAGGRYIEQILSHFGVRTPDYRLDRAEYLGGNVSPVTISEVLQQSATSGDSPLGDFAGHATNFSYNRSRSYRCDEHGWLLGIMSVMPITAYSQGQPRMFTRKTWDAYYFPQFAHIGEQMILNSELFAYDDYGDKGFGYTERYAEYKYMPSRFAGQMRTEQFLPWHLGRVFGSAPQLNRYFVNSAPAVDDMHRIFADTSNTDHMFVHIINHVLARRPLPRFGVPRL